MKLQIMKLQNRQNQHYRGYHSLKPCDDTVIKNINKMHAAPFHNSIKVNEKMIWISILWALVFAANRQFFCIQASAHRCLD